MSGTMNRVRLIIQTSNCAPIDGAKMEYNHFTEVVEVSDNAYNMLKHYGSVIGSEVIDPITEDRTMCGHDPNK